MSERRNNPGFTLVEMLVALAMIATIVSMVYGSYAATSRSLEIYDSRLTCSQRTDLVLRLMARQLRCAYSPPAEPNAAESLAVTGDRTPGQAARESAQTSEIRIPKPRPAFLGGTRNSRGEVLDFLTTAGLAAGPNGAQGLARIGYRHDPVLGTLAVSCRPHTDSVDKDDSAGHWQIVLRQVADIEIEFHDGLQWQPQWSSDMKGRLPRAVRLGLTVTDEKNRIYHCGTTVEIRSQAGEPKNVRAGR